MKYSNVLSPIKIGNVILKNRLSASNSTPHFLQGPETFPSKAFIDYYASLARNGAAVISLPEWNDPMQRKIGAGDSLRMPQFDTNDPSVSNILSKMADEIHFYGSKVSVFSLISFPEGFVFSPLKFPTPEDLINAGIDVETNPMLKNMMGGGAMVMPAGDNVLPAERMHEAYERTVKKLRWYKEECGYDMCNFIADFQISGHNNARTDEYGGSFENRTRFFIELAAEIKKALGKDFLIEIVLSGEDDSYSVDDMVAFAKRAEGLIDIFQVRCPDGAVSHGTTYNIKENEHPALKYAEAIKRSGAKVIAMPITNFQDPQEMDDIIREGRADMIAMARAWIADFEYGTKMYEGRADDITPCIRCNKCHGIMRGPWINECSVNPLFGISDDIDRLVRPAVSKRKIAVIGGGPAGMQAAKTLAERGHDVTLYEKTSRLGGQMMYGDYFSFKWPIRKYRDFMEYQLEKLGVKVILGTTATPDMIQRENFDGLIAAVGAVPNIPDIKGIEKSAPLTWIDACINEEKIGKNVIIVGGSETGTETGMHLAEKGHDVKVLTRKPYIAYDASPVHGITCAREQHTPWGLPLMIPAWDLIPGFTGITSAATVEIGKDYVIYQDKNGDLQKICADSVILCGGMKPCQDEAMKFAGLGIRCIIVGDCRKINNIQRSVREGFAAACQF